MSEYGMPTEVWREEGFRRNLRELLGMMEVFITLLVVMFSWGYAYGKTCQPVHFKYVQLIVSQSRLNKAVILKSDTKHSTQNKN